MRFFKWKSLYLDSNVIKYFPNVQLTITHWGGLTHMCVSKLTIIGSYNGLALDRRHAIIWTYAEILLIPTLGTNFSGILNETHTVSFKKMHFEYVYEMAAILSRPQCVKAALVHVVSWFRAGIHQAITWTNHDDVIKWKYFPRYWPFVWGIHRSPVNSPHKGLWRWALKFSLICAWIKDWVSNRGAGDLRRHRAHCDVTVMNDDLYAICIRLVPVVDMHHQHPSVTHWGRVTHKYISELNIIGSDNALSLSRRQVIRTSAGILLIWPWGTIFSEMLIENHTFS